MKTQTLKEKRQAIINYYNGIPEKQVSAGIYIHTIGRKYITLVNTWGTTKLTKIRIEDFQAYQ